MDHRVISIEPEVGIPRPTTSPEESVHCSLPGNRDDVYNTYRFIYSNETDVNAIAQQLVEDKNQTAAVVLGEHNIIFTINRTTYYKVHHTF